ncbi:MAG: putative porin [Planctomycetota bacterium]
MRRWMAIGVAMYLTACLAGPLQAQPKDDQEDLKTTLEALKQRLKDQDQRIKEQDTRLAELEQSRKATSTLDGTISGSAANEAAQREIIRQVVTQSLMESKPVQPAWMENLKLAGDFRLRYEFNGFNWGKTANTENIDRNRARFRLRFGLVKTWLDDQLEVGFRLASGSDNDANSTNQTFTQDFSKKPVWIDLAYAKYTPKDLKGLTVIGGKMVKPWAQNDIFWDTDVNPEGFWAEYKAPKMGCLEPFVGAGYFIVNESATLPDSAVGIYQAGVRAELCKDVKYTFAANFQEWTNYNQSGAAARGNDSPLTRVPGFRIVNLTNNVDIASLWGRPLNVFADYAYNSGPADESSDRYEGQNSAFALGTKYGQNKKKGDWSVKYRYAHVEANALPGTFCDSDFGFANRKGHVIGAEYSILDSLSFGVNCFLTQPIFSPSTTSGSSKYEDLTTTLMFDLLWKF